MALPKAFDERIRIQLGDEYEDYIKCFDSDMYHGIRVNTSKISVEDFLKISPFELEPVPWTKNGFTMITGSIRRPSIHTIMRGSIIYRSQVP